VKTTCRNIDELRTFCSKLYAMPFPITVAVRDGTDRSLDQNALAHKWFSEVGHQMGESMDEVKARAKLDIGCIILCRDDPDFLAFCKQAFGGVDRETRLARMKYVPVTSIFTVQQMSEFMDTFERQHRAQGLHLTQPEAT